MTALLVFLTVVSLLALLSPLYEPWLLRHDVGNRLLDQWESEKAEPPVEPLGEWWEK